MYFDSNSHNVYITKAELAAADEWAQTFLGANCTATKGNWSSLATSFAALDSSVKAVFTGVAYMAPDAATSTYYEAAVQRYDLIIMTYGKAAYNDFMGRESAQSLTYKASAVVSPLTINSSNAPALVIVVSSIAFTLATGGYFFLRKKKEQ